MSRHLRAANASAEVCDVTISGASPLGVTLRHPVWSVDREDWIPVGELEPGETLETIDGTAQLVSVVSRSEAVPVYNIEVATDHTYRVGELGLLVHNESEGPCGNPCEDFTYHEKPPGGGSWTDYVINNCSGNKDSVKNPHGHHIVMKGDRFPENAKARAILCKYGIDPYLDCRNLVISRNYCHSKRYAQHVLAELKKADKPGASAATIADVLEQLAEWHKGCEDFGKVDPKIDEV